jgi:Protein of unknown function (DUF3892)
MIESQNAASFMPSSPTSSRVAFAAIEAGTRFYVETEGRRADVVVALRLGRRYLKTRGDSVRRNNLLRLPPCS